MFRHICVILVKSVTLRPVAPDSFGARGLVVCVLLALLMGQQATAQNLVRNPGFEEVGADGKPASWETGDGSRLDTVVRHTGNAGLLVAGSAHQNPIAVKARTGYRLSVWAKRDHQGITRLMAADAVGNMIAATDNGGYGIAAWSGTFDWERFEVAFRTGDHTAISIYLLPLGGREKAWYDNVELVEDDSVRIGDVSPTGNPLPELTAEQQARGYLWFSPNPLARTYHTSVPTRVDIVERLTLRAAPGEYEPTVLAVHALRPLSSLRVWCSDLVGSDGARIDAGDIECRAVRSSRRDLSSVSYVSLPLFLAKASPEDLDAGSTRVFWLTVHVPDAATAGPYRGSVSVRASDAPVVRLPIEVHVRALQLLSPPVAFGMYYQPDRMPKEYRSRKYQELYYRDMRAHGMTSVTTYNYPSVVTDQDGDQRLAFGQPRGDYLSLDDEMALIRDVGPSAPGIPLLYLGTFAGGPSGPTWARAIQKHQQEQGWPQFLFYISDEPTTPDRIEAAKRELAQFAGLEGIRTVTAGLHVDELGPLYDVWIQQVAADEHTQQRAAEWGKLVWSYDCQLHGATPRHDRYVAGLHTWAWRKSGVWQWAYTHFDDRYVTPPGEWKGTDAWQYGYVLAGPDGPIPTLGWEGRREGIDDFRYLHTLEVLAEQARQNSSAGRRAIASQASLFLDGLRASVKANPHVGRSSNMNEYATNFIPQPEITPSDYDRMRQTAAKFIERLQPTKADR